MCYHTWHQVYPVADFPTFEAVMDAFLKVEAVAQNPPEGAALAIAGEVDDNRCAMTNTSWVVDGGMLEMQYGIKWVDVAHSHADAYRCLWQHGGVWLMAVP